jgi:hypothetical protein
MIDLGWSKRKKENCSFLARRATTAFYLAPKAQVVIYFAI